MSNQTKPPSLVLIGASSSPTSDAKAERRSSALSGRLTAAPLGSRPSASTAAIDLPGQAHRLGGFDERLARHPEVLDLVVERLDLVAGAGRRDLALDLVGDLRERLHRRGRDALDAHDHRPELALQHPAHAALRQGEHRVGLVLVEHRVLGRLAEVGVFGFEASLLDQVVKARAGLELRLGRAGVGLVGEQDLLQVALLGRAEPRILAGDLLVGRLGVGVAHLGRIGDRVRLERAGCPSPGTRARDSSTCGR